jgi:hypothetical protein
MKTKNWSGIQKIGAIAGVALVIFLPLQFITPQIKNPPVAGKPATPKDVTRIFERACYDCHSNETQLKWFDKIVPASWEVSNDVEEARSRFNFSEWDKLSKADQQVILWKAVNAVITGKMPLPSYVALHPETNVTSADIETLKKYINSLPNNKPDNDSAAQVSANAADNERQHYHGESEATKTIPVALNGVRYVTGYQNWQVISTTNRFDNNTMRIVYGNDITVKAIKENNINPFPNGATIVKVVWNKIEDKDDLIRAGAFNAVQIMIKDEKKYPRTGGWGFAIFNGLKLVPTGKTALFENDCFNCHKLQASDNGYVFNIPLKDRELDTK